MKEETKKLISILIGYFVVILFVNENILFKFIALCISGGLVFSWKSSLATWVKIKYNLLKNIRKRNYFYVTEKGYKTDLKKRRELGSAIYALSNLGFIALIMIVSAVTSLINYPLSTGLFGIIISRAMIFALIGIILSIRNYLTGMYYYFLPWLVALITIDYVDSYSSVKSIIIFMVLVIISYIFLILLLPLHSLRKITSSTWLFGVLTTLIVPLFLEYFFKYHMVESIQKDLDSNPITLDLLNKQGLTTEILSFIKENPYIIDLMNRFREMSIAYDLNSFTSDLSTLRFLLLTSYSIGTILITLKIKLGKSKAEDIYSRIKSSGDVQYNSLRDCIFYGGDEYENKIMANSDFEAIIISKEQQLDKYIEQTWWIKYPSKFVEFSGAILKKLI
ncbi:MULTISPECIES: hypothetical protein [Streptococcus]|uniref:Membrane protein n=1 Tax=Streptococcus oralis subsp. tigurinus 2426 TaxID=1333865 RepID=S9R475_STROR|nr:MULTISPECIES: hypothetical protein [Streptococcus]EMG33977.1 hypothetical protein H353_08428 [Streptococcus oralis subsp. tigurinus 1366]EPX88182.1 membrane protein [Streptococcus oralis subsp. tigurinus 2425]EPX88471.1 membrane protein [Streptococcus oralis subsp. tigurinus 2426]MDU5788119.1 hypothetical protein [Streptococcus parasanguinis]